MSGRGKGPSRATRRSALRATTFALLLLVLAAPAGFVAGGERSQPYVVVFDEDAVSREQVAAKVSDIRERMRIRVGNVYDSALRGFAADLTDRQVAALEADPSVERILPDEQIKLAEDPAGTGIRTTANADPGVPPGVRRVGAHLNALAAIDGEDTRVDADVAVLDTGIDRDHRDLNVAGGYNCTSRNRARWGDADGHGTHVAGTIGALDNRIGVVGVAPGVRLWSVKVLDARGSGRLSWFVCGIDWVTAQKDASDPSRPLVEVANMSISYGGRASDRACGKGGRDRVHQAICRSVENGTVYVVAAGNESRDARRNHPASYDEVITVSALADFDGTGGGRAEHGGVCPYGMAERDDAIATFSNHGADVDLIAPGRCVLSTYTRNRYAWMSGTSMAAPHVSGAAALYRAMYSRATPHQVKLALQAAGTQDWRTSTDRDTTVEKAVWIAEFPPVPDFTVSVAPSHELSPGEFIALDVSISRFGGFTEPVSLEVDPAVTGFSAKRVTARDASAVMEVEAARSIVPGRYVVVLRARSTDIRHATVVYVVVDDPSAGAPTPNGAGRLSDRSSGGEER